MFIRKEIKIITDRFTARPPKIADATSLAEQQSDRVLQRNLGSDLSCPVKVSEVERRITARSIYPDTVDFVIEVRGRAVGMIEFSKVSKNGDATVAYWIGKRYQRRGITSRAVRLALEQVFTDYQLLSIMAKVMPWNEPSKRLLLKAGFTDEGLGSQPHYDAEVGTYYMHHFKMRREEVVIDNQD